MRGFVASSAGLLITGLGRSHVEFSPGLLHVATFIDGAGGTALPDVVGCTLIETGVASMSVGVVLLVSERVANT